MEDKMINRIFVELDGHTDRLITLSEIVHKNAGILGIITKLVIGIILALFAAGATTLYTNTSNKKDPAQYQKTSPVEIPTKYKIIDRKNENPVKLDEGRS